MREPVLAPMKRPSRFGGGSFVWLLLNVYRATGRILGFAIFGSIFLVAVISIIPTDSIFRFLAGAGVSPDMIAAIRDSAVMRQHNKPDSLQVQPEQESPGAYSNAGESLVAWQKSHSDCGCRITSFYERNERGDMSSLHRVWYVHTEPATTRAQQHILNLNFDNLDDMVTYYTTGLDDAVNEAVARTNPHLTAVAAAVTEWHQEYRQKPRPVEVIVIAEDKP